MQVDLLFSILSEGKTLFMQETALRCIHCVYRRGVLLFPDAGNVKKLLRIVDDPNLPTGFQCQALRILCRVMSLKYSCILRLNLCFCVIPIEVYCDLSTFAGSVLCIAEHVSRGDARFH